MDLRVLLGVARILRTVVGFMGKRTAAFVLALVIGFGYLFLGVGRANATGHGADHGTIARAEHVGQLDIRAAADLLAYAGALGVYVAVVWAGCLAGGALWLWYVRESVRSERGDGDDRVDHDGRRSADPVLGVNDGRHVGETLTWRT